jgi:hypothetical protein
MEQNESSRSKFFRYAGIALAVLMGTSIIGMMVQKGPSQDPPAINYEVLEKNMRILTEDMKLVDRIKPDLHKVWVDGYVWQILNAEHKENAAKNIAHYIGYKSGGSMRTEIYDKQSGKMIAEYSEVSGFTVK